MDLHEYQAKQVLARHGIRIPQGQVASTPEEARDYAARLLNAGARQVVVKAQIHAGGRGDGRFGNGPGSGIRFCRTEVEAFDQARLMLGQVLVTNQTGPGGRPVQLLLVEEALAQSRECYAAVFVDRAASSPVVVASAAGGKGVDELAASSPERLVKEWIDPLKGISPFQARRLALGIGLGGGLLGGAARFFQELYSAWYESDAYLVEVNPLGVVASDAGLELVAIDAKMNLDDGGLFRHPDLVSMRDEGQECALEAEARKNGLHYVKLDGNIGCLVNGAGLAMATMDLLERHGGAPANFLDVGGGASVEQVAAGLKLLIKDPGVACILVNIFGGIAQCDVIARGVVEALKEGRLSAPIVVRMEGDNRGPAVRVIEESGLAIRISGSMSEAAQAAVRTVSNKPRD